MTTTNIIFLAVFAFFALMMVLRARGGTKAKGLIAEGALVIDVRSPGEFLTGHLNGAHNVPVDQVPARLAEIESWAGTKDKAVVVYCASGMRSARAQALLRSGGFTQVTNGGGYAGLR